MKSISLTSHTLQYQEKVSGDHVYTASCESWQIATNITGTIINNAGPSICMCATKHQHPGGWMHRLFNMQRKLPFIGMQNFPICTSHVALRPVSIEYVLTQSCAQLPSCMRKKGSGQKGHTSLFSRYVYCGPIRLQNHGHMTLVECNYVWSVCTRKWRLVSIVYTPELPIIAFQPDALD